MKPAHLGLGLFLVAHTMLFAAMASAWLFLMQSDANFSGFMGTLSDFMPLAASVYWPTTVVILAAGAVAVIAARKGLGPITLLALALLVHGCLVGALTVHGLIQAGAPATGNLIALFTVVEMMWLAHAAVGAALLAMGLLRKPVSVASSVFIAFTAAGWVLFRVGFALT